MRALRTILRRQLAQVANVIAEDELNTAQKVSSLKEKIANGDYNIDSLTIAGSIEKYLGERA